MIPNKTPFMQPGYRQKLFEIATRPRKIHDNPEISLPRSWCPIPKEELFRGDRHRRVLELGSGWGDFLVQWLRHDPRDDYVAFEMKAERIQKTLKCVRKLGFETQLKIIPINFNWFLEEFLPAHSFDLVIINFPDPWPKRRHWKHRLIQVGFDQRLHGLLRAKAKVHLATDYGPYARKMLNTFRHSQHFKALYPWPHYLRQRPVGMPSTRFERLHLRAGRRLYYSGWQLKGPIA